MGYAVLKLEPENRKKEKLTSFKRVMTTSSNAPAFILESEDIERLAFKMPQVPEFPFSFFIDNKSHVHFEVNYSSYFIPTGWREGFKKLLQPDRYLYDLLRKRIIEGSLLKKERHLIGGGIATYYSASKTVEVKLYGLLKPEDCVTVDPFVRKNAFAELTYWLRPFASWLGADRIVSSPCVIPVEKMKRIGWTVKKLSFNEWKSFVKAAFPLSLVRKQRIFECDAYKRYTFSGAGKEARTFSEISSQARHL